MNRLQAGLSIAILIVGGYSRLLAQNPPPQNDAERLRVELAERVRQEAEQRDWETRIFQIKYVDPNELRAALSMFRSTIGYSGGGLRVLSIRAPKEIMPAIEDAIKRLDVPVPRHDAELTIYVLLASDQVEPSSSLPPALNSVVNQLKAVLSYKAYRLLDTLITRATSSPGNYASLSGTLTLSESLKPSYGFRTRFQIENPDGKTPVLRLNDMSFSLQSPNLGSVGISGDVEVPAGQQVVVGKTTMADKALILVMTSKFSN